MTKVEERRCTKCEVVKPLTEFAKAPRGKYGRGARCRDCVAAAAQARYVPKQRTRYRHPYAGDEIKTCTRCLEPKPLNQFSLSRKATETRNAVYRSRCKKCHSEQAQQWHRDNPGRMVATKRRLNLAANYGMTLEDYESLLRKQGGVCAICQQPPSAKTARDKHLVVDHDHVTGVVRGLLCHRCNRALGLLGDDAMLMRRAISYLRRSLEAAA